MASERPIGVVVGLATEARIVRPLGWPVAIGGGTAAGAATAAQRLVAGGAGALVSFGLAGGLDPALPAGTLLIPRVVIVEGDRYPTDPDLSRRLGGITSDAMFGGEAVVATVEAKRRLYQNTAAAAVDLESGAVACVARANNLPFAVLRAICDPAGRALPHAACAALDDKGSIVAWRVLVSLGMHPGQLPALLSLATDAAAARRQLTKQVRRLLRT